MQTTFETEGDEFRQFVAANQPCSLIREVGRTIVCTGDDYTAPDVPAEVSRRQLLAAVHLLGLTDDIPPGEAFTLEDADFLADRETVFRLAASQ